MVPRSDPDPLTHNTRVGRARKSASVALAEVLPPPQLATEPPEPRRCERHAGSCSGLKPAARSALQRFSGGRIGKASAASVTGRSPVSILVMLIASLPRRRRYVLPRAESLRHWKDTRDTGPPAAPRQFEPAPGGGGRRCRRRS